MQNNSAPFQTTENLHGQTSLHALTAAKKWKLNSFSDISQLITRQVCRNWNVPIPTLPQQLTIILCNCLQSRQLLDYLSSQMLELTCYYQLSPDKQQHYQLNNVYEQRLRKNFFQVIKHLLLT